MIVSSTTIGHANYKDVRNEFYNDVDGVILMYDVTDKSSLVALPSWLNELREFGVTASTSTLVVVGNKIDHPRVVTEQQVRLGIVYLWLTVL